MNVCTCHVLTSQYVPVQFLLLPTYRRHYTDRTPDQCRNDSAFQHRWRNSPASHQLILFAVHPVSGSSLFLSVTSLMRWVTAFPVKLSLWLLASVALASSWKMLKTNSWLCFSLLGSRRRFLQERQALAAFVLSVLSLCRPTTWKFYRKMLEVSSDTRRLGSYRTANVQTQTRLQTKKLATIEHFLLLMTAEVKKKKSAD